VLNTRTGVKPIYVSQGHRVSLETLIRLTIAVSDAYRIPRPTREADHFAGEIKRKVLAAMHPKNESFPAKFQGQASKRSAYNLAVQ
jgi:hypothetical protein